jgi:hypothetical protein
VCRSIKTLRPPYTEDPTKADIDAAALQYVRKVAGMRAPAAVNQEAFERAVTEVAAATEQLLAGLVVRSSSRQAASRASS